MHLRLHIIHNFNMHLGWQGPKRVSNMVSSKEWWLLLGTFFLTHLLLPGAANTNIRLVCYYTCPIRVHYHQPLSTPWCSRPDSPVGRSTGCCWSHSSVYTQDALKRKNGLLTTASHFWSAIHKIQCNWNGAVFISLSPGQLWDKPTATGSPYTVQYTVHNMSCWQHVKV